MSVKQVELVNICSCVLFSNEGYIDKYKYLYEKLNEVQWYLDPGQTRAFN